jgi:hypothetical protein
MNEIDTLIVGGCSGDNQSWRIVRLGDDGVVRALLEASVWVAASLVVVLLELVVEVVVIVLL